MDNDQPRNIQSAPPTRQTTTKASTKRRAAPKNEFDNFHSIASLAKGPSSSRLFSPLEAEMWTCTTAANFAAGHYVPMCRRLGIITRTLKGTIPSSKAKRKKVDACGKNMYTKVTIPSLAQARKHVQQGTQLKGSIEARAITFQKLWKNVKDEGMYTSAWNGETGEIPYGEISCFKLLNLLKEGTLRDIDSQKDTYVLIQALSQLMTPHTALYNQPLVLTQIQCLPEDDDLITLKIAVYASRLLFECMTRQLQTVMNAFDNSSVILLDDLMTPPSVSLYQECFESSSIPCIIFPSDDDSNMQEGTLREQEDSTRWNEKTLDAFSIPGLLKLIESKGTFDEHLWESFLMPQLGSERFSLDLMIHQKHGILWMYQMEKVGNLNRLIWQRRQFVEKDSYYYSPSLGQVRLTLGQDDLQKSWGGGGILADEMGLGKTIQVLALIVATLETFKEYAATLQNKGEPAVHSTLIIVPPALLSQWIAEIHKAAPWLVVDVIVVGSVKSRKRVQSTQNDPLEVADVVLTTYQALENNTTKASKRGYEKNHKIDPTCFQIDSFIWGRIVLDEMQEIRSWTTRLSKVVCRLRSDCRWMLSGTPLLDDINDLKGELCFLGLEPFSATNDDGFFQFAVASHWEYKSMYGLNVLKTLAEGIMLRRSKSMVITKTQMPLLGLKEFTVTYEPIPQDTSERALYCFVEFLMHSIVSTDQKDEETTKEDVKLKGKKMSFLRLLRELCLSVTLLNGGLGCASQLSFLNRCMKEYNRTLQANIRQTSQEGKDSHLGEYIYSCDEAVRYLSQIEDFARTDSNFVTDVRVGGGGGIAFRNRALVSVEDRYKQEVSKLYRAKLLTETWRKKRAKALWHKALEAITTGEFFGRNEHLYERINPKFRSLWGWRKIVLYVQERLSQKKALPVLLTRGWRPSEESFLEESPNRKRAKALWKKALKGVTTGQLRDRDSYRVADPSFRALWFWRCAVGSNKTKNMPSLLTQGCSPSISLDTVWERYRAFDWLYRRQERFYWAYPFALLLSNIPIVVNEKDIRDTLVARLKVMRGPSYEYNVFITSFPAANCWKALVYLRNKVDYDYILGEVKRSHGIRVFCERSITWIDERIKVAKTRWEEAAAAKRVHPNGANNQKESTARKEFERAKLGLRIVSSKTDNLETHIFCSKAVGPIRSAFPSNAMVLFKTTSQHLQEASSIIEENKPLIMRGEKEVQHLKERIDSGIADNVASLTTFQTLQALKGGKDESTICPICFGTLGNNEGGERLVALTKCGHLCCRGCMDDWLISKGREDQNAFCVECRKPIAHTDVVSVDPKKTSDQTDFAKRQEEAKSLLQQAAEMLESNHGQLDSRLWEALYLSMDLPNFVNCTPHDQYTAIPPHICGHLRHATEMKIHCRKSEPIPGYKYKPSSKIRALLTDLPRGELSVVFASSKVGVQHVSDVLRRKGFGCRALYTGQTERDLEIAVSEWQTLESVSVLVVQAGAAACGLTLTAASKMFLLEPFLKHEQEKQAYARLHRYGQEHEVFCKVYYAPVSVESRLLEWRHRSQSEDNGEESEKDIIFAPLREAQNEEDSSAEEIDVKQTEFLLGLL